VLFQFLADMNTHEHRLIAGIECCAVSYDLFAKGSIHTRHASVEQGGRSHAMELEEMFDIAARIDSFTSRLLFDTFRMYFSKSNNLNVLQPMATLI
jgi:hypothetical protein